MTGRLAGQAIWNLRLLGLFLLGPVIGVLLVDAIFGLPGALQLLAGAMFLFSLALFAVLVRGERQRLERRR